MSEQNEIKRLQLMSTKLGARLFRNNVGLGWAGEYRSSGGRDIIILNARPLHAGLCEGSSDTIGWTPVTVTSEMVGKRVAIFTAAELKLGSLKPTDEQLAFIGAARSAGAFAFWERTAQRCIEELECQVRTLISSA